VKIYKGRGRSFVDLVFMDMEMPIVDERLASRGIRELEDKE